MSRDLRWRRSPMLTTRAERCYICLAESCKQGVQSGGLRGVQDKDETLIPGAGERCCELLTRGQVSGEERSAAAEESQFEAGHRDRIASGFRSIEHDRQLTGARDAHFPEASRQRLRGTCLHV